MFAPPLAIIALAGLLALLNVRAAGVWLMALAAALFLIIILPASAFAEIMLFLEHSAPLSALYIFCFIFLAPICLSENLRRHFIGWIPAIGLSALVLLFFIGALFVLAYSPSAPQPLSITHIADDDEGSSEWVFGKRDPLPDSMGEVANFETVTDEPSQISAPAPAMSVDGMRLNVTRDSVRNGLRTVTLRLDAPGSDRVYIGLDGTSEATVMSLNGLQIQDAKQNIVCSGRSCRNLEIDVQLPVGDETASLNVSTSYFGLGPESRALEEARPDWAMPIQLGDRRIRTKTIKFLSQP